MLLAIGLVVIACGCGGDAGDTSTTLTTMAEEMGTPRGDMDDGAMTMDMGNPNATPAEDVIGAELVEGTFVLLDTRPNGYDDVSGTAVMARSDAGTTVTIRLEGLPAGVEFISHVHEGACAENGGDHYKFDPAGSDVPPNEIHLSFTSSTDGGGFMTAENHMTATAEARSVVVHPVELLDNKIACAELDS